MLKDHRHVRRSGMAKPLDPQQEGQQEEKKVLSKTGLK